MEALLIKLTNDIKNIAIDIARALLETSKKKSEQTCLCFGIVIGSRGGGSRGGGYNTKQLCGLEIVK